MRTITYETCDSSTAELAAIGVTVHGVELLFCRHHFHQHAESLAKHGGVVTAVHSSFKLIDRDTEQVLVSV